MGNKNLSKINKMNLNLESRMCSFEGETPQLD